MYLSYGCKNILYQGSSDAQSTERLFQVSHLTKLTEMQGA